MAVGPVHAGVIEPGHFRFQCHGEEVFHLEISLGYQHRGAERSLVGGPNKRTLHTLETVAGDTTIGHATAYCQAVEALAGCQVPIRAEVLRGVCLELERLANHTGDLGGAGRRRRFLAHGFLLRPAARRFPQLDRVALRQPLRPRRWSGPAGWASIWMPPASRSAWNASMRPTATWFPPSICSGIPPRCRPASKAPARSRRRRVWNLAWSARRPAPAAWNAMFGRTSPRAFSVSPRCPFPLGPPAMSSPGPTCAGWRFSALWPSSASSCRPFPAGRSARRSAICKPDHVAVTLVEGWRGEICHVALTDARGRFARYKIVDPSFHNWTGLAHGLAKSTDFRFPPMQQEFQSVVLWT